MTKKEIEKSDRRTIRFQFVWNLAWPVVACGVLGMIPKSSSGWWLLLGVACFHMEVLAHQLYREQKR